MNGASAGQGAPAARVPPVRLPTVAEALQFSPLTSIVPFSHDVIPLPEAIPVPPTSSLLNREESALAIQTLSFLSSQASNLRDPSSFAQDTLRTLQKDFLNGDNLTRLKFKAPPLGRQPHQPSHLKAQRQATTGPYLQPFSKLVLESANIPYRCAALPRQKQKQEFNGTPLSPATVHPIPPVATSARSQAKPAGNGYATPKTTPVAAITAPSTLISGPSASLAVIVPSLPTSSAPAEYQKFPELDAAIIHESPSAPRKRKRDEELVKSPLTESGIDQFQADMTVNRLQELMFNIFEAEDHMEPDTSILPSHNNQFFMQTIGSDKPLLTADTHAHLEQALMAVMDGGRYSTISIDRLARVQRLCLACLATTSALNLSIPQGSQDESTEQWVQNLELVENSFKASRVLLRMMAGEREEKQLYSEEILLEMLGTLKHVFETCIIPVVELRTSASDCDSIKSNSDVLNLLTTLLQRAGKVLKLVGDLLLKIDVSESAVTSVEFLAIQLIFVENAPFEKDSLLGIQRFETLRRHAMELVAKIFLKHPEQRSFMIDEILTSLEKLPVTRQNARHYKLVDGKPIQLVSALIMLLVQTSAVEDVQRAVVRKVKDIEHDPSADEEEDSVSSASSDNQENVKRGPKRRNVNGTLTNSNQSPLDSLSILTKARFDSAQNNSSYVGKYLVQRAMTSTKTGDQPYRNLLDIFTEDFISVLGSPDWPASELLLRAILSNVIGIADNEKSTAPAKNMALEIMALMGSGIADVQQYVSRACQNLEVAGTPYAKDILHLCEDSIGLGTPGTDLFSVDGPCRAVIAYYQESKSDALLTQSAQAYFLVQWARNLATADDTAMQGGDTPQTTKMVKLAVTAALWLQDAIQHPMAIAPEDKLQDLTAADIRLSYNVAVLNLPFCKALRRMISIHLAALTNQHALVRSKSLKGLTQLLEKDPSIIERFANVLKHIMHCASDSSPLVRESALGLLGKCMILRPSIEPDVCRTVIAKTLDPAVGVRKRAMKLLKEIFSRNKAKEVRASIASALLYRLVDDEESVAEIARQTIEEIWFAPFQHIATTDDLSLQTKQDLQRHAFHIVSSSLQRDAEALPLLETLLKVAYSDTSKTAAANIAVSKHLVSLLFDNIIDNDARNVEHSQPNILQTLTVFAKCSPRLFTADQMVTLKPYISNLSTADDLTVYRSVLVIYRFVLPVLPPLQYDFLSSVQTILFNSISKLRMLELLECAACLWIIDAVVKNTDRLVRLMLSVLAGIESEKKHNLAENAPGRGKLLKYMTIAGCFGKTCNFDDYKQLFKGKFPTWKGEVVSDLLVEIICPLSRAKEPLLIREAALESICLISQNAPKNFVKAQVTAAFTEAFREQQPQLELIILTGIKDFYAMEEERSKSGSEIAVGAGADTGAARLGKSMVLNDNDGATTSIAQHYLSHILRIALSSTDELAVIATEVIASTNRQGLVHPKETGAALVALETSPNATIATIALNEHRNLHTKHESMLEKEYVNAVEHAFAYQKEVVRDVSGVDSQKQPKLRSFYDVLKGGTVALRKKLLANICIRLDPATMKTKKGQDRDTGVDFARFVLENIGLLDYGRIDELLHLLDCIEKIFAKTGNELSHRIEAALGPRLEPMPSIPENGESAVVTNGDGYMNDNFPANPTILRELATSAAILSMLWETRTHLRRLWNLQSLRDGKAKPAAKDLSKAPTKVSFVSADKHLERIAEIIASLHSEEKMLQRCRAFMDLLSVDNEAKMGSEPDESGAARFRTPSVDDVEGEVTPKLGSGAGAKRKGSASARSTPSKPRKKGRPSLTPRKRSRSHEDEDAEGDWE